VGFQEHVRSGLPSCVVHQAYQCSPNLGLRSGGRRPAAARRLGRPIVSAIDLRRQNHELAVARESLQLEVKADAFGMREGDADFGPVATGAGDSACESVDRSSSVNNTDPALTRLPTTTFSSLIVLFLGDGTSNVAFA
jgi:hypothetical protein